MVRWTVSDYATHAFSISGHRYSTGSNLNANSALIQNLYSQETTPLQAVHLVVDTGLEESGKGAGVKAYIRSVHLIWSRTSPHSTQSSPVGITPKPENCVFVPVPVELRFRETEKSGCESHFTVFPQ